MGHILRGLHFRQPAFSMGHILDGPAFSMYRVLDQTLDLQSIEWILTHRLSTLPPKILFKLAKDCFKLDDRQTWFVWL
jgi:hypothetical protein